MRKGTGEGGGARCDFEGDDSSIAGQGDVMLISALVRFMSTPRLECFENLPAALSPAIVVYDSSTDVFSARSTA